MAKVIYFNVPAHGHVNPMLAMVETLVQQGEEVIFYTSSEFKEKVERTGAQHRTYPCPLEADQAEMTKNGFDMACMLMEYNEVLAEPLLEMVAQEKPDYIIQDPLCIWARIIIKKMQIPGITAIPFLINDSKSLLISPRRLLLPTLKMAYQGFGSWMQYYRYCYRIQKKYGVLLYNMLLKAGCYNDLNISFTSSYFQPDHKILGKSFRFVGLGFPLQSTPLPFPYPRQNNEPILYISMGTIMSVRQNYFYQQCFEAFGNQPFQVVLSVGTQTNLAELGTPPPNFIVRNFVPQLAILQHADIFITHAGMNSLQESFYYGVPVIAIPQSFEQSINANRVEELGGGIYLAPENITPENLRQAVNLIQQNKSGYTSKVNLLRQALVDSGGYRRAVEEIWKYKKEKNIS